MKMKSMVILLLFVCVVKTQAQDLKTYGVQINVTDLDKALGFYSTALGFDLESRQNDYLFLKSKNNDKLVLHLVKNLLPEAENETRAGLTLQVNDLDSAIGKLKSHQVYFGNAQKRKEGVGYAIFLNDPFGTRISLMHQTIVSVPHFTEPRFYNYGFRIPNMDKAIDFYCNKLGFVQRSQRYLPLDMPLGHDNNEFAFMLHYREGTESIRHNYVDSQHVVILLQTLDLNSTIEKLKSKGVEFLEKQAKDSPLGKTISFYDPFGYLTTVVEVK
jgi:catechol 2,3-dioxygenase-like lactoylglutathione lyase family enzyme